MEGDLGSIRSCVACGYDVAALATRTCPECGYTATDEDVALAERRAIYRESTSWEVWVATGALAACAFLCSRMTYDWTGILWFAAFIMLFGLGLIGGFLASRGQPAVHRRAFRRAWHVSVIYWLIPALSAHIAFEFVQFYFMRSLYGFYNDRYWWATSVGVDLFAFAASTVIWYRAWKRSSRLAGVPEALRTTRHFRRGMLAAAIPLLPVAGMALLFGVVSGAMALLDMYFPGWELGR